MATTRRKTKLHNWRLKFDRIFSESVWQQILVLIVIFLVALVIGWIVCSQLTFGEDAQKLTFWEWALYILIDGNALNTLYMDDFPEGGQRWVMLFVTLGSLLGIILFGGMLISIFTNMLERRIENYRSGKKTYLVSGHTVVLGYDEIVPSIIRQVCEGNQQMYVLLQSSLPSEELREKLRVSIAQEFEERIIIRNGHRTSLQDLQELRLAQACSIYVVGDRTAGNHDAMNIECLDKIAELLKQAGSEHPDTVTAVFEDAETYAAMQVTDLFDNLRQVGVEFVPFNFYVDWAKQMFVDCNYTDNGVTHNYPHLDRDGIAPDDHRHVHLVIVGASTFGMTLAIEAAKMLHFPNFDGKNHKTEITFIDLNADQERFLFLSRYRHFFEVESYRYEGELIPATKFSGDDADFLDVEFGFVKGDIYSPEIQKLITQWATDGDQLLSIVLAMTDARLNMSAAMSLPDEVYESCVPVFVRQNTSSTFLSKLQATSAAHQYEKKTIGPDGQVVSSQPVSRYANIYPFGMTDIVFDVQKRTRLMGECINYLYHLYFNTTKVSDDGLEGMMKYDRQQVLQEAHALWKTCKESDQWSSLYGAYNIPFRVRTFEAMGINDLMHLDADLVERMGIVEHNRWTVEKLLMGFRKPLPNEDSYNLKADASTVKDFKKNNNKHHFIHSDIRPFNQLDSIQEIDKEIVRFIPWFLKMTDV